MARWPMPLWRHWRARNRLVLARVRMHVTLLNLHDWSSPMTILTNRRVLLGGLALGALARPSMPAFAQDDRVESLLKQASETMAALSSFHFHLETVAGSATIMGALELRDVEGDVVRPASFQATITAKLAVADVTVEVISIDGAVWATNPISDGDWEQLSDGLEDGQAGDMLTLVLNPESIFLAALTILDEPKIDGSEEIGGLNTKRVVGSFVPTDLQSIVMGGTPVAMDEDSPIELSSDPVDLTVWIADDGKVIQIEEEGPLLDTESRDVIRRFTFSNFDQPVEILPPT